MHPVVPVLQLINALARIEGRKKMQKTVHILKELGAPFQERFEYSYYGMYSAQLKGELEALAKEGLISESESLGTNKSFIFEAQPEAAKLLAEIGLSDPPPWIAVAEQLNALPSQVLEGISTILFLRRTETDAGAIRRSLLSLKPHLEPIVDQCFGEADALPKLA